MGYIAWSPCPKCEKAEVMSTPDTWVCKNCGAEWDTEGKIKGGHSSDTQLDPRIGQEVSGHPQPNPQYHPAGDSGYPDSGSSPSPSHA